MVWLLVNFEVVWLDIFLHKTNPILVGTLHRPRDQQNFYNILDDCCSNSDNFIGSESILIDEFNTNVLGNSANCLFKGMNIYCNMYGLKELIKEPTRITNSSH